MQGKITHVFRERKYLSRGKLFCIWYELCPVIKHTAKFVTVASQSYDTIHYPGGDFRLSIASLVKEGFHHHTRHGERFWLKQPRQGDLFPTQQLIDLPSSLEYEAQEIGWDIDCPRWQWHDWQKHCFIIAGQLDRPLREVVDRWKVGGEKEIDRMWAEVRGKDADWLHQFLTRYRSKHARRLEGS